MSATRTHYYSLPQGKLVFILLGIIFLVTSIGVIYFLFTHSVSTIVEAQITAIRENDLQKAYAMTTSAFKNQTSFQTFKEYVDSYPVLRQNKSIDFEEDKVEEDFGYVSGIAEAKDGTRMFIEYQLIREDSKWKVQAIRLSPVEE